MQREKQGAALDPKQEQEFNAPEPKENKIISEGKGEAFNEGEGEPDYKALYEKEKEMRQGLVRKVEKLTKQGKSSISPTIDDTRLDKIELRQLQPDLTAEEIENILTIKKAKGYSDVGQTLEDPLIKAFLKESREQREKKEKVNKAIPKPSKGSSVSSPTSKSVPINKSKNWAEQIPKGADTQQVAEFLEERFFPEQ